ncbi:DNA polymerase X family protein [Yersinia phage YerA41]|uniref:DNA polymerase X family protein n=1 Tax=Yersinia phage vB_Yru_GN1 TaxID=3074381 RepID=A0AA86MC69_9CAUD|nr:DNA polymerase X family protein [Yersinia phage YerA41]BES79974.1 DNA polymerase X family protein [Yersinia phage vB_Yru_GN1]
MKVLDKSYVVYYLNRLAKKYPLPNHKYYAFTNAASAIAQSDIKKIDNEVIHNELKKVKFVGPFIKEILTMLVNEDIDEKYVLENTDNLIDCYELRDVFPVLIEKYYLTGIGELKSILKVNQSVLDLLNDKHLEFLNLNRSKDWVSLIATYLDNPKIRIAGSMRRGCLVIKDFDLVTYLTYPELRDYIASVNNSTNDIRINIIGNGKKRVRINLINNLTEKSIEGDVRIVNEESIHSAMLYFTGPKSLNVKMRGIAKSKGLTLNEYGIVGTDKKLITFNSEEEIFKYLGMKYLAPTNRK